MINDLIKLTNAKDFYQNSDLIISDFSIKVGDKNSICLKIKIEIKDIEGDIMDTQNWKLEGFPVYSYNGFYFEKLLPYVKLKILHDHPLLWAFKKNELICELTGFPENPSEFIGDLFFANEKCTGNWIPIHKYFFNINTHFKRNGKITLSIPEPLKECIKTVCDKHNVVFKTKSFMNDESKGYANRPNAKLLLFGNEDVCPHNFNLRQPYIIADEFKAEKL